MSSTLSAQGAHFPDFYKLAVGDRVRLMRERGFLTDSDYQSLVSGSHTLQVQNADKMIELHVTSLDAVHSFWAYSLGVKADANLNTDNVVYVRTRGQQSFDIRCAELCGLWHGYMFDTGRIVSDSAFAAWIHQQQQVFQAVARYMPPYSTTYAPKPQRRAG